MKKYDEASVVRTLAKNPDIEIDGIRKLIEVTINSLNVGNGSWGKIDYLVKIHGYVVIRINPTERMIARKEAKAARDAARKAERAEKRSHGMNLVGDVKANIKKPKFKK